jgi:hypothetical protein
MCQLSHFASRAYAKRKRIERRHFNAGQWAIELADQVFARSSLADLTAQRLLIRGRQCR